MIETQISIDSVFQRQSFNNNVHLAARLQLLAFLVYRSNNGICAIGLDHRVGHPMPF